MEDARRSGLRRLHSISGVVPVGAFLAFHLYTNAAAERGADAYNAAALRLQRIPAAVVLEVVLIAVPLLFHGIYGLFLAVAVPAAAEHSTRGRRALAILQRVTGVFLFAFILFHLWTTRLVQVQEHESLDLFRLMQAALASPWIHAFYVAGTLAATWHLASGLWTFSVSWGWTKGRRAEIATALGAALVFAMLSVVGLRSLAAFALTP